MNAIDSHFYAVNPLMNVGVTGGEEDVRLDELDKHGHVYWGGRPNNVEKDSSEFGKTWRNDVRDEIARQRLICPLSNYYRERNRVFEDW
jgi:hypothetical protein